MKITSTENDKIKHALQVKETKYIQKYGECFVESEKVVDDLLSQGRVFSALFIEESKETKYRKHNAFVVTREVAKKLSSTVTTDGVFGIVKISDDSFVVPKNSFLVLDRIQDPTNVGAIMRSAVAFGYNEIYMIDCAYPYSSKVIRSSMGHVFNTKINLIKENDFIQLAHEKNLYLLSADMDGKPVNKSINLPEIFGIIMGNEGQGVSGKLQKICKETVSIPMTQEVESLNVSVSAGILMYNLKNRG